MKGLNLNACGVQEMNVTEMMNENGGSLIGWFVLAIAGGLIYDLVCHPDDVAESYARGAEAGNERADHDFR